MFGAVLGHGFEQRLCLTLDNSKFEEHGGIEHSIGILLKWEYPLVLASTNGRPAANGLLSRYGTILMIADDAT